TWLMEDYMSTQSIVLRSYKVAKRACEKLKDRIDKGEIESFPTKNFNEFVNSVREGLLVTRDNKEGSNSQQGNNVLILTFRGPKAGECQLFLEKIIEAYQEYLNEVYASQSTELIRNIENARSTLDDKVKTAQRSLADFRSSGTKVMTV